MPLVAPRVFEAHLRPGFVLAKGEMIGAHGGGDGGRLLLDARAGERYRGETEPIDPRAGHIPGAKSAPFTGNLSKDPVPVFLPSAALRDRYTALGAGREEPIDPRAGHIPGAKSAPFTGNLSKDPVPVFLPSAALRARYTALGAGREEPIVYCGSGVTACHDLLALHLAGLRGQLYAGSWSEWSSDPSLPVETGAGSGQNG